MRAVIGQPDARERVCASSVVVPGILHPWDIESSPATLPDFLADAMTGLFACFFSHPERKYHAYRGEVGGSEVIFL